MLITQDLHMHTHLSLCAKPEATLQAYLDQAKEMNLTTLGIADHFWDDTVGFEGVSERAYNCYSSQNLPHIALAREEFKSVNPHGVRVLFGAETEYHFFRKDVALTPEHAQTLDFLLVPNSHTHMTMPGEFYASYKKHAGFIMEAAHHILSSPVWPYITAFAHPFDAIGAPYPAHLLYPYMGRRELEEIFCEAKEKNIAIEINTGRLPEDAEAVRTHPKWEIFALAKECGCKFTFGSDCHKPEKQKTLFAAQIACEVLSLREEDILKL